jgi:hypothetical protein
VTNLSTLLDHLIFVSLNHLPHVDQILSLLSPEVIRQLPNLTLHILLHLFFHFMLHLLDPLLPIQGSPSAQYYLVQGQSVNSLILKSPHQAQHFLPHHRQNSGSIPESPQPLTLLGLYLLHYLPPSPQTHPTCLQCFFGREIFNCPVLPPTDCGLLVPWIQHYALLHVMSLHS